MKVSLVLLIAVFGLAMVAAEETLESKLQMALKSLLQENEELNLEGRDTKGGCERATNNCNSHGDCVQGRWGQYYCKCTLPYRVGGSESSCYMPKDKEEDVEIETKDTVARCERDTKNCDGHGTCQLSTFGRRTGQYICFCDAGYRKPNSYGGCSPSSARELEYLSYVARDVEMEMLARDSVYQCNRDTNSCDGFGKCEKSTFGRTTGQYICNCDDGYRNNAYGGCSPRTEREIEYLSMIARDQELEMQARDSLPQCNRDTNYCDGFGQCVKSTFGRTTGQYICSCNDGYENNLYGGCSPKDNEDEEVDTDRKMEILRSLANLLDE